MSVTTEANRVDQLEQRLEELEAELEEKEERIQELEGVREQNQKLRETVEEQGERINKLETELQEYRTHNEKDKAKVKRRVTDLENQAADTDDPDEAHDDIATEDEPGRDTPLAQIVHLPESVAQQELTANQERARFIATDILDYATKVPAGYAVTSSDIRTILAAKEGGTPHTETVSRVMNFLDRFGQDDVEIVKRRGKRRVVFIEAAAKRFHAADARDQEQDHDQDQVTGVVMVGGTG